ncbi:Ead/Ea22-like protein [Paraburkholderia hospita]|nr:Ead/Ea22-like protein [Paraburkholderia hospita]
MNIDTNKLREIAKRATPGPWKWWTGNSAKRLTAGRGPDGGVLHTTMVRRDHADVACGVAHVDHISAVDPTTVLALLDQVERLQFENAQLSALIDIPELHDLAKSVVLEATHQ